jgi:hypothetical protein
MSCKNVYNIKLHPNIYYIFFTSGSWKSKGVFFRSKDPSTTKQEGGAKFIFTNIPENKGNAYDNYTGVFIAPVTGTYYFVLQLCLVGYDIDLAIRRDGNFYSWARFYPHHLSCQTVDMLTPLQQGEAAYATQGTSRVYDLIRVENDLYNTFSGILIA